MRFKMIIIIVLAFSVSAFAQKNKSVGKVTNAKGQTGYFYDTVVKEINKIRNKNYQSGVVELCKSLIDIEYIYDFSDDFKNFVYSVLGTNANSKDTLGIVLDMFSMSPIWLLYNSIKLTLYLKFFKRSVALPKCMKFSKW